MYNFSMKKKVFLKNLAEIFEKKKIDENDKLSKLEFDSLKILELIAFKEKNFKNIKIELSEYSKCNKVNELIKLFKIKNEK
jgi:acyl carrier protein